VLPYKKGGGYLDKNAEIGKRIVRRPVKREVFRKNGTDKRWNNGSYSSSRKRGASSNPGQTGREEPEAEEQNVRRGKDYL